MINLNQNIWKNYGFTANPFNTSALSLREETTLPIAKAFVGRGNESRENMFITNILRNPGGARFVIEGPVGVGKTSFVNYHRSLWEKEADDKLLTPEEEISVCESWTVKDFLLNVMGALVERIKKLPKGESYLKSDTMLEEISLLNKVHREKNYQGGFSFLQVGVNIGQEESIHVPQMIPEVQLTRYFRYLVKKVKELGFAGVFLHLDNLELLRRSNIGEIQVLFENLRDTLQTPDVYFALVGYKGFFYDIIAPCERLKSVFFGRPILIPPLSIEEMQSAIERRYKLLKLPDTIYTEPFERNFIDYLYNVYRGKMRFVMEAINTLVPFLSGGKTLSFTSARFKLKEILTEEVIEQITPQEWEVLKIAVRQEYFTNKDICKRLNISAPNVTRTLRNLIQHKLITQVQKESRYVYYQVNEDIRIILDKAEPTFINIHKGEKLSGTKKRAEKAGKIFSDKGNFTTKEYATTLGVSIGTARKDIKFLLEAGRIAKKGKTKNSLYSFKIKRTL